MNAIKAKPRIELFGEFLRPNWWKVGIFIVLGLVVALSVLVFASCVFETIKCPAYFLPLYSFLIPGFIDDLFPRGGSFNLIGFLVYYYLLACLIYFIFVKVKRLVFSK